MSSANVTAKKITNAQLRVDYAHIHLNDGLFKAENQRMKRKIIINRGNKRVKKIIDESNIVPSYFF